MALFTGGGGGSAGGTTTAVTRLRLLAHIVQMMRDVLLGHIRNCRKIKSRWRSRWWRWWFWQG